MNGFSYMSFFPSFLFFFCQPVVQIEMPFKLSGLVDMCVLAAAGRVFFSLVRQQIMEISDGTWFDKKVFCLVAFENSFSWNWWQYSISCG